MNVNLGGSSSTHKMLNQFITLYFCTTVEFVGKFIQRGKGTEGGAPLSQLFNFRTFFSSSLECEIFISTPPHFRLSLIKCRSSSHFIPQAAAAATYYIIHPLHVFLSFQVTWLKNGNKIFEYINARNPPYRNFTIPGAVIDVRILNRLLFLCFPPYP